MLLSAGGRTTVPGLSPLSPACLLPRDENNAAPAGGDIGAAQCSAVKCSAVSVVRFSVVQFSVVRFSEMRLSVFQFSVVWFSVQRTFHTTVHSILNY